MTRPDPSIAVLIPAYNQERYLDQALESVLAQTRAPEEIIVVDDASTDATAAIAARYPVRLVRQARNCGVSVARNTGIAQASAQWIANLDGDDWWRPDHLAVLADLVARAPEAVVAWSDVEMVGRAVSWQRIHPTGRPFPALALQLYANQIPQSASMMRREVVTQVGGYDPAFRICQDYDLWVRVAVHGPFIASPQVTACYRWHDGQASRSRTRLLLEDIGVRAKALLTMPEARPPVGSSRDALIRRWEDLLMETWEESGPSAAELLRLTHQLPALRRVVGMRARLWSTVVAGPRSPRGLAAKVARTIAGALRPHPVDWPPRPPLTE